MKLLFILLPCFSFAQEIPVNYILKKNSIEFIVDSDTVRYDFKKNYYSFGDSYMKNGLYVSGEKNFKYKRNILTVGSKEFIFRKPMFSKQTYVLDKSTNTEVLRFKADYKNHQFIAITNDDLINMSDETMKQHLLEWAYMKQAQYVHYNADDLSDAIMIGIFGGLMAVF